MVSWLDTAISAREPFAFGELTVEPSQEGWLIRGPRAEAGARSLAASAEAIRRQVRFDDTGRYRPLSGARNLPSGWFLELPDDDALIDAIETIYPLAVRHTAQAAAGTLRTVSLEAVLERQSGRYESSSGLSPAGRAASVAAVCGNCVRTPAWDDATQPRESTISCPEPCGIMVSFCREAAIWEQERPSAAAPDPTVAFADFESAGNELREAWLGRRFANIPLGAR